MYFLTQSVKVLSTGLVRVAGDTIQRREVPEQVFERWVRDGIVTDVAPAPDPEPEIESPDPLPPLHIPAYAMPEPELRELAKELGISHYWNKSLARIVDEVEDVRLREQ